MAHTKGPWKVYHCEDEERAYVGIDIPNHCPKYVCRVSGWGDDYLRDLEQQDNAKLIAAAPRMIDALKQVAPLVDNWVNGSGDDDMCAWAEALLSIQEAIRSAD